MKKQRQRWTNGAIVKIPLDKGTHSYGQLLDQGTILIFKILTSEEVPTSELLKLDMLFIVSVYNNVIPSGRWPKIGKEIIRDEFKVLPLQFIQDSLNPTSFQIYNPNDGSIRKASREECNDLECCAVWTAEHVESRIIDTFNGVKNVWVEQLKIK